MRTHVPNARNDNVTSPPAWSSRTASLPLGPTGAIPGFGENLAKIKTGGGIPPPFHLAAGREYPCRVPVNLVRWPRAAARKRNRLQRMLDAVQSSVGVAGGAVAAEGMHRAAMGHGGQRPLLVPGRLLEHDALDVIEVDQLCSVRDIQPHRSAPLCVARHTGAGSPTRVVGRRSAVLVE